MLRVNKPSGVLVVIILCGHGDCCDLCQQVSKAEKCLGARLLTDLLIVVGWKVELDLVSGRGLVVVVRRKVRIEWKLELLEEISKLLCGLRLEPTFTRTAASRGAIACLAESEASEC